jgi:hypothetical protein
MKFSFSLMIFTLCFSPTVSVEAKEKKIDLKPKAEKVEDPGSATHLIYKAPGKDTLSEEKSTGTISITATCTDNLGMVHKKTDKSYEACLRNLDKTKPENNFNEKNPKSLGITIGN